jgi:hypothetical protein
VDYEGEAFEKGEHACASFFSFFANRASRLTSADGYGLCSFKFSFVIPSSTAPSQRCGYGRIIHTGSSSFPLVLASPYRFPYSSPPS